MSYLMDRAVITMPFELAMSDELSRRQFYDRAHSLLQRLDRLLQRHEANSRWIEQLIAEQFKLIDERDALRRRVEEQAAEVERLRAERDDDEATRAKMADILSRTAVALRWPEPEGTRWGWSDLPERVAAERRKVEALRKELDANRDLIRQWLDALASVLVPAPPVDAALAASQKGGK